MYVTTGSQNPEYRGFRSYFECKKIFIKNYLKNSCIFKNFQLVIDLPSQCQNSAASTTIRPTTTPIKTNIYSTGNLGLSLIKIIRFHNLKL